MKFLGNSIVTSSVLGLVLSTSFLAGCSSSRKHDETAAAQANAQTQMPVQTPTASATVGTTDIPADDSHANTSSRRSNKSPANLGAASSGQGL